jgi:dTDP-4-amino-4,6-dideoxygalactose transaminase
VIAVDLYGRCADHGRLTEICAAHDIPLLVDAAESLGATRDGVRAGGSGHAAVFSFNGNKIITTSGGGAVVTDDAALAARVRHLSTQAREPEVHYEHVEVGFNYRMSNILAALGRVQLGQLDERMARRRATCDAYRVAFADIEGMSFPDPAADEGWNGWLTCVLLDPAAGNALRKSWSFDVAVAVPPTCRFAS